MKIRLAGREKAYELALAMKRERDALQLAIRVCQQMEQMTGDAELVLHTSRRAVTKVLLDGISRLPGHVADSFPEDQVDNMGGLDGQRGRAKRGRVDGIADVGYRGVRRPAPAQRQY
jgi:hypothetical protein